MRRVILLSMSALGAVAFAFAAYLYFAGGTGEPSTELTTPVIDTTTTTAADPSSEETTTGIDEPADETATTAFVVDPAQSIASFEIDEVLRGSPERVVGATSDVAGQVALDPDDTSTVAFSDILINARTFRTDSSTRDRAIRGPVILNSGSDEFELITFSPTSVDGLSLSLEPGVETTFVVAGDLTVKGTTRPVEFTVTATMVDESTIEGVAEATVVRSDFGIGIPNVASVADVGEEVLIRLEFVATAAS